MNKFEYLDPINGRKSFCRKAFVITEKNGSEQLYSYGVPIVYRNKKGKLFRCWNNWSSTTGKHIKAFCGLNKKEYFDLPERSKRWITKQQ